MELKLNTDYVFRWETGELIENPFPKLIKKMEALKDETTKLRRELFEDLKKLKTDNC